MLDPASAQAIVGGIGFNINPATICFDCCQRHRGGAAAKVEYEFAAMAVFTDEKPARLRAFRNNDFANAIHFRP